MSSDCPCNAGTDSASPPPMLQLERKLLKMGIYIVLALGVINFIQNSLLATNTIQIVLSLICTLFALTSLAFFDRLQRVAFFTYSMIVFFYLFLIALWFFSDGFNGSTPNLYFLYVILGVIFARTHHRVPFIVIMLLTLGVMLFVEYTYPGLVSPYADSRQRFLDAIFTFLVCIVGVGGVIYLVFNHYLIAVQEIKALKGIFPVCSHCYNIRDEQGQWERFETYFEEYSEAQFSHSICPQCANELYPELKLYEK